MNVKYNKLIFSKDSESKLIDYDNLIVDDAKQHVSLNNHYVGIEAVVHSQRVGFIFARLFDNQTAQIFSWFVESSFRKQSIGLNLFEHLITFVVKEKKVIGVGFAYEDVYPASHIIEKILARQKDWPIPDPHLIRYYFDSYQFDPSWIYFPFRSLETMQFFKWKDLTEQDRQVLQKMKERNEVPGLLWPFREEEKIEYRTSIGLRNQDELVGWSITHRLEDTLRYSILYIQDSYHRLGYGIQLLIESIKCHDHLMHGEDPIPQALFEVRSNQINSTWARFIEKRLRPHATRVVKKKWVMKYYHENMI